MFVAKFKTNLKKLNTMNWKDIGETFIAVLLALVAFGFIDKLVVSKLVGHLENLIEGN